MSSGAGVTAASVADSKGSNYNFITGQPGFDDGNLISNCAYALNTPGGITSATVTFAGGQPDNVQAMASEFAEVAAVNAADGSSINKGTGGNITAGSFTPSASGDLIYNYVVQDTGGPGSTASFTTGPAPWTMLSADIQDNMAAQYQVQTAAAPINSTMTLSAANNASLGWSSIAFALKPSATAGTGVRNGIRVLRVQHEDPLQNGAFTVQMPCSGNLLVAAWLSNQGNDITGITDDHSNTWQSANNIIVSNGQGGDGQIFYASNANCSATGTNLAIHVSFTGTNVGSTIVLFDVAGAAASPFDTATMKLADDESATTINAASITPSTSNGLIIGELGVDANSVTALNSAGNFLAIDPTPDLPDYPSDENNGWMMFYNPSASPYSSIWTINGAPGPWVSMFAAFKAAN